MQTKKDAVYYSEKLTISYKSGAKFPARTYVYEGQAVPSIKIGRFGNVVIGERIGGMDGMYVATYLTPVGGALKYLGGVEVSMTNGKFVSASIKQNNWSENIGDSERKRLLVNASSHADNFLATEGANAIDDVLLFFAVPDLMAGASERNHDFARDYSKMIVEKIDSSLGNMIRRRFVGRNQSLCDEEQFDIFSCSVGEKIASVCLTNDSEGEQTEYRYGTSDRLDLKLVQSSRGKSDINDGKISFLNKNFEYVVLNKGEALDASVLVKKDGELLVKKQCLRRGIEPMLFPVR